MIRTPEDCRDMDELRKEIDRLDERMIRLLSERVKYVARAVEIKRIEKLPALIPERVQAVLDHVKAKGQKTGVDPELAENVWRVIIDWAVNFEKEKLKK
ncbi:MAG: chorismate mutase [Pseudomonadota bacterium]